jgi:hypothetical protein
MRRGPEGRELVREGSPEMDSYIESEIQGCPTGCPGVEKFDSSSILDVFRSVKHQTGIKRPLPMSTLSVLVAAVRELAKARPVFHSEADFQHALAWQLQVSFDCEKIRLEVPFREEDAGTKHLDLLFSLEGQRVAVELKYKTRKLHHEHAGEFFALKDHGAENHGRYDFLRDIQRLEQFVHDGRAEHGVAILLTNNQKYWSLPSGKGTLDSMFRLTEERVISGRLTWSSQASAGTTEGRADPIILQGTYTSFWQQYSKVTSMPEGEFRFLAWQVE